MKTEQKTMMPVSRLKKLLLAVGNQVLKIAPGHALFVSLVRYLEETENEKRLAEKARKAPDKVEPSSASHLIGENLIRAEEVKRDTMGYVARERSKKVKRQAPNLSVIDGKMPLTYGDIVKRRMEKKPRRPVNAYNSTTRTGIIIRFSPGDGNSAA